MESQCELVCYLSNGAIFSDLELDFKVTPLFDVEYLRNCAR